jgi:hypothetical protein
MQLYGSQQVSPRSAQKGADAEVYFAGVAQLVEHLFCKQVVAGSSPTASSAVGRRVVASGSHARGFRVLASFALRSDAHALKCVPLRSSRKPRQNAELRARVIGGRPRGTAAAVACATTHETSESCPSGQREQAVNLPDLSYAGSNPALSTSARRGRASVSITVPGSSAPPRRSEFGGAPPQVLGPQPQNTDAVRLGTSRAPRCSGGVGGKAFAGVAQLVERQPSKLNVESSSLFSRSATRFLRGALVFGSVSHHESKQAQTFGQARVGSLAAGQAEPRTGAERTSVREHRTAGEAKPTGKIPTRQFSRVNVSVTAHLAQMVEHVLGKDEVTSSILVVGSKQNSREKK